MVNFLDALTSSSLLVQMFDHILVAIEDISGQIGHNYMRDKYGKPLEQINVSKILTVWTKMQLFSVLCSGGITLRRSGCLKR